ncbi:MAG TPA: HupE/UreJ family protein, partial [Rhizomicrobium sp.]|nr:HupE/UreJ family protein [Rhizomicrobium sp.]
KLFENGRQLPFPHIVAVRMALDSDRSFATYDQAMAEMKGPPLAAQAGVFWEQAKLDVWFEYPIQSDRSNFSIHAAFDRLAVHETTALQFMSPNGITRAYDLAGDAGVVSMDPNWLNAATRFVSMGFHHILEGIDHLLFLFALIIPFRRIRPLIPVVTAFTIAHSITLIASAYGYAPDAQWFPPLIEMLIAVSILYMALENIVVLQPKHRWVITFFFGLVHGFGFSWVLRDSLQLAGSHVLLSLLSFNVGVELGQLFMLALFVPALNLLFRHVVPYRMGSIILSALVAHQAWHWMEDRWDALSQFSLPSITPESLLSTIPYLIALVVMAAALWLVSVIAKRWGGQATPEISKHAAE